MKREILDGNTAVAKASYKLNDVSFIYPITPSSTMAEVCDEMATKGEKNIFGNKLLITQMQSEGGASGALHGASLSGSVATTFTSSQGLLLMLPNMYKIAGEMLPVTINVASRSIATHSLNIFCDHSDIMSARQTGFAMICSSTPQEAYDFAVASNLTSIKSRIPFLHFFDGFRTSHEINIVETLEDDELIKIYPFEKLREFKQRALSPNNPKQYGTSEGPALFFQGREKSNNNYKGLPNILIQTFGELEKITGRKYNPFEYYGSSTAKYVIVCMGSSTQTIKEYIKFANDDNIGLLKVNLYRPFSTDLLIKKLPSTVQKIAVLDRTKEQGSAGEPLYLDVSLAIMEHKLNIEVIGGRYGLGGKEFNPAMVKAVYDNLKNKNSKNHFTVGIIDDLSNSNLEIKPINIIENSYNAVFYGFGSDGTVSASKNIIKIVGENTDKHVQAYFMYDSKKSGGLTRSYLRFDNQQINKPYLIDTSDIVVCCNASYLVKYNFAKSLKENAILLINSNFKNTDDLTDNTNAIIKKELANKNIKVFSIDANSIAKQHGLGNKISSIMQIAFFEVSKILNYNTAIESTTKFIEKSYLKKGKDIVDKNIKSILCVKDNLIQLNIDKNWKNIEIKTQNSCKDKYIDEYINPVLNLHGDDLPVSKINLFGENLSATSKHEKRNISNQIPQWFSDKCLQCGKCSFVCPHSVIKAKVLNDNQLKNAPDSLQYKKCNVSKQDNYVLEISPEDCTGCGLCESVCPVKDKAIKLQDKQDILKAEKENYTFTKELKSKIPDVPLSPVKTQFMPPYFEYSGACAGCGETAYIKLLTQLFGNRLIMANATGCSSIYGGSAPTCPYTKDNYNQGTAWANSLFEDNAEFGLGINQSIKNNRNNYKKYIENNINNFNNELKQILNKWLNNFDNEEVCQDIYLELKNNKNKYFDNESQYVLNNIDNITKKSVWIVGGDGWAYDIGFGGLDHVLASGENVNILVLDTEVYSNTGGQMSKSSQLNSVAKFCTNGKTTSKKRLALMAMNYKNVYVAQICLGANNMQTINAFKEASEHNGPSIIIAYCPCINHGINMKDSINIQINAVNCGYWHLFRYNPNLIALGKNPLIIDSKAPSTSLNEHLLKERRYANFYENKKNIEKFIEFENEQLEFYNLLLKLSQL